MNNFTNQDMEEALQAITSMINRSEKAQEKFRQGTSQHTLQKNRIKSLYIALLFVKKELTESDITNNFTENDFEMAVAPITSLISKSEKSRGKVSQGTWQYTMLCGNLKALYIALSLLKKSWTKYGIESKKTQREELQA